MDNSFLRNFIKARNTTQASGDKKKTSDSLSSTSTIPLEKQETKISINTIIEDCPSKAKVMEYLRHRIEELEEDSD